MVEGTRLLIWRTGNGTEGSNPSLSANVLAELLLGLAGALECRDRNAGLQLGVEHDLYHSVFHAEYEHAGMKAPGANLPASFRSLTPPRTHAEVLLLEVLCSYSYM